MKRVLLWKAVYSQASLLLLYLLLRTPRSDGFSHEREEVREEQAASGPGSPASWPSSHHVALGHFPISSSSPTGAGWRACLYALRAAWLSRAPFLAASVDIRNRPGKDAGQWLSPCAPKMLWDVRVLGSHCTSIPSAFWKYSSGRSDVGQRLRHITGLHSHP